MAPAKGKKHEKRYLFKITVVGPDDELLEDVLSKFNEQIVAVDGIRISSIEVETDDTDVRTVFMSPKHSALDLLLSLSYTGANAVIIALRESDPEVESEYRDIVRESIGTNVPTRVISFEDGFDSSKREELSRLFDEIISEILESRKQ